MSTQFYLCPKRDFTAVLNGLNAHVEIARELQSHPPPTTLYIPSVPNLNIIPIESCLVLCSVWDVTLLCAFSPFFLYRPGGPKSFYRKRPGAYFHAPREIIAPQGAFTRIISTVVVSVVMMSRREGPPLVRNRSYIISAAGPHSCGMKNCDGDFHNATPRKYDFWKQIFCNPIRRALLKTRPSKVPSTTRNNKVGCRLLFVVLVSYHHILVEPKTRSSISICWSCQAFHVL